MKALKEVKKSIAGGTLIVTQFPVLRAIRIGAKVARLAAPIFAGLGGGLNLDDIVGGNTRAAIAGADIDLNKAIPGALNALAEKLDPNEFSALCEDLLSTACWIDAKGTEKIELSESGGIDRAFGGSIPDLFAALRAALEANDFFGLGAIGRLRGVLGAPQPKSPDVSTPT